MPAWVPASPSLSLGRWQTRECFSLPAGLKSPQPPGCTRRAVTWASTFIMKVSAYEMSPDLQIRGKGNCSTTEQRHGSSVADTGPQVQGLPQCSLLQTSWSLFNTTRQATFHPGAHTCDPRRQPALASSSSAPGAGGRRGLVALAGPLFLAVPSLSLAAGGPLSLPGDVPSLFRCPGRTKMDQKPPQPILGPRSRGLSPFPAWGSLAALSHVPEELLALLVTKAPQAVRALKVPLSSPGRPWAPALSRGV